MIRLTIFTFSTIIISMMLMYACKKEYQPPACNYNIHIPDTAFKNALLDKWIVNGDYEGYLDENKDGEICDGEASRVMDLYISDPKIRNIEGIEHFVNLKYLDVRGCNIESISFSSSSLVELNCNDNILTTLDISRMNNLTDLWCNRNDLTDLDVSKNTQLKYLHCDNNLLSSIDLSNNLNLKWLTIGKNNISSLNVDCLSALEYFHFDENNISAVNISKNGNLKSINFKGNPIYEIDLSKNPALTAVWFGDNPISVLDISKNQNVNFLRNDGEFPFEKICVWTLPFPPSGIYFNTVNFPNSFNGFMICD
jgi:Leucine-rich repeat (LRR) protein